MTESQILTHANVEALADLLADAVAKRVEPLLGKQTEGLVGRQRMAELANISVPSLDRMVSAAAIPSIRQGTRRLFEPTAVFAAMREASQ